MISGPLPGLWHLTPVPPATGPRGQRRATGGRPTGSIRSSSRAGLPAPVLTRSRILCRRPTSPPRRGRSTRLCRSGPVLRSTRSARHRFRSLTRDVRARRESWPACEWRSSCRSPVSAAKGRSLHLRRRRAPGPDATGRLTTRRAGPDAAGGRRRIRLARCATAGGLADVEIRHAAALVDVDLAAAQKHGFELLAGALHA